MKLTTVQKVAVALSVLWFAFCFLQISINHERMQFMHSLLYTVTPPFLLLWFSGALKSVINWFKGEGR